MDGSIAAPREVQGYIRSGILQENAVEEDVKIHHRWLRLYRGGFTLYKGSDMVNDSVVAVVPLKECTIEHDLGSEFRIVSSNKKTSYLFSSSSERAAMEWVSSFTKNLCYSHVHPDDFTELLASEPKLEYVTPAEILRDECRLDDFVDKMRKGLEIKTRVYHLKSYAACFTGRQACAWLSANVPSIATSADAVAFGQALMDRRVFNHVCASQPFADEDYFYRFQADEAPDVLNMKKIWATPARDGNFLAEALRKALARLMGDHMNDEGIINVTHMKTSQAYRDFSLEVSELQRVDLRDLDQDSLTAFFINLYNTLVIHGLTELGPPTSAWQRSRFYSNTKYNIGGLVYSLNDIEHGVLRANKKGPGSFLRPFKDNDPRAAFSLPSVDCRIHFALNCGAKSCPPIKVYRPDNLDRGLQLAARSFCKQEVVVQGNEVSLSMIMSWYSGDFGDSKAAILRTLARFVDDETSARLLELADTDSFSITYRAYDWSAISA